jgi:hypothetical protein
LQERLAPASYTVNALTDTGSGSGTSGDLRYCVGLANADASAGRSDTIAFAASLKGQTISLTKVLQLSGASSKTAATITIDGGGQIKIDGGSATGLFQVNAGVRAVLRGLTLSDGSAVTTTVPTGGGISTAGTLTVSSCTFSGDSANLGGGIYNTGTLTVTSSTFSGNSASEGGGIYNVSTLTVTSSTFSGNSGSGIYNTGTLTIRSSTFSTNSAQAGGGIFTSGGKMSLVDSIVAGNSGTGNPDIQGPFGDSGHNLLGTALQGVTRGSHDVFTNNPLLAPLGNYGGPTPTMPLLPGSRAYGAGIAPSGVSTDQRGQPRSVSGRVDIGAFEDQLSVTPPADQLAIAGSSSLFKLGSFKDQMTGINTWTVTIDWGDHTSNSTLTVKNQGTLPMRSHTYARQGRYTVTVTVTDAEGNAALGTFKVNAGAAL